MTRPLSWPTQQPEPTPPVLPWPSGCPTQLYPALPSSTQQPEPTQQRRHDPAVELAYPATGTYPAGVELAVRLPYAALRSNRNLPSNVGMTRPLSWPTQQPEPTPPVLPWPSGCPGRPVALRSSTQQLEPTQQRRHDPAVELAYAATGTYPAGR